jgi:ubiquinone/menaquinone biosynthesis C-methylase UbiE
MSREIGLKAPTSSMSDPFSRERVQAAYDAAAEDYQVSFGNDLARLQLDRDMLDVARLSAADGPLLDLGCGTGSAGTYLSEQGAGVVGLDLSLGMLKCIPGRSLASCQGDMRRLPFGEEVFAAVIAYYSIHSVPRSEVPSVLAEASRVLRSKGVLLLSTHIGEGEVYVNEFLRHRIDTVGGTLYTSEEVVDQVSMAGFTVEISETRGPLAHEHPSQRVYVFARRTA